MSTLAPGLQTFRVLVVDDNPDTADSCAELVRLWGHEAVTAYDGQSALDQMLAQGPQVVLLDLEMPRLDGHEVRRRIRTLAGNAVTVIAVSGHAQKEAQDQAMLEGFFCYLTKPFDPQRLQALLALLKSNQIDKLSSAAAETVK
jgi:CheY-like chemotaxis protein